MTVKKEWNPGVAALLSFVIPGAGQIYKGAIFSGLLWLVFVAAGYFAMILPGVFLHIVCIYKAFSGNPYSVDPNAPTPETHVKCPDCRELVFKDATKCKHCGCKLIPQ
jgi:hypothetical protein